MTRFLLDLRHRVVALAARFGFFLVSLLPTQGALRLGASLGRLASRVSLRRSEIAQVNLRIAYPEWSEEQRRRVMREAFENLGRSLIEVARLERLSPQEILARTTVVGREYLDGALETSEVGVLVVTGHVGNWELLGAAMALRGYPITIVYRPRVNPYLERRFKVWRTRAGLEWIPRGSAARGVLRALRARKVVALPLDQNVSRREGIFVPFFGRLACSRGAPARLAMRTGAPLLPVFIRRVGKGPNHVIHIDPPLELVPASEPEAVRENVRRINQAIESAIRSAPEQWTWNHRRWKTQPRGEPRPYRSTRDRGPLGSLFLRRSRA